MIRKTLHPWWTRKIANPISKIDDDVRYIFREHNQEADHWANVGVKGEKKLLLTEVIIQRHGRQSKDFGIAVARSGCGAVSKGCAREERVTTTENAVPSKIRTAKTAEMMGVCVLTGILDLMFNKCPCVLKIDKCIDKVLAKQ